MNQSVDRTMSRVVAAMYERLGDELTVDDLARTAMYSKFHFSRMFRRTTGVSPGRFLSAVRFQEAKLLLVSTSLSIAEISNLVGYSSLGTFSARFKKFVGLTPTEYRRRGGSAADPAGGAAEAARGGQAGPPLVRVHGQVCAARAEDGGPTFVGLFPDTVPHASPVGCTVLSRPGYYVLDGVPEGTWYLIAHSVVVDRTVANGEQMSGASGWVGRLGPITIRAGAGPAGLDDLHLRPMRVTDLPVLPAPFAIRPPGVARPAILNRLRSNSLERAAGQVDGCSSTAR